MQNIDLKKALAERGLKLALLASAMGVDKGTVTRWGKGRIPAERVIEVERVTGIPRADLRPDLYGQQAEPAQ